MTPEPIEVLIVDDQEVFRDAARMVVDLADGFEVVAEADNGEDGVRLAEEVSPDLVLIDVQMPGMNGLEATRMIRDFTDPPKVVVMSTHESGDYRESALQAGASAFIPKAEFSLDALEQVWLQISG